MATYYIDPAGDDITGDGSIGSPWLNLAKALDSSGVSDTIIVKQGTYLNQDPIPVNSTTARVRGKTITGETNNPRDTILDFNAGQCQFSGTLSTTEETFTISNLTIRNIFITFTAALFHVHKGIINTTNCIFQEIGVGGTSNTGAQDGSVYGNCNIVNIERSIFINCYRTSAGTVCAFFGNKVSTPVVATVNNSVFFNSSAIAPTGYNHISIFASQTTGGSSTHTIKNIIYKSDQGTVTQYAKSTTPTTTYSCLYNTDYSAGETGVIEVDPLFVDDANGDFRLRPTSPCIGTGTIS